MNSLLITPTFDGASRLTRAGEGRQLGLAAKVLAICTFLLGLSPFASWSSELVNIHLASVEALAESLQGTGLTKRRLFIEYEETHGLFEHFDELAAVQGIGSTIVEKNRSVIGLR